MPAVRICRESLLTYRSRIILFRRKGGICALFLLSGEDGLGQRPKWVKGLVPCRFSGQRPEPSESFLK